MRKINKKGQEEMVGFALILIIVAVLILIFFSLSLKKPSKMQESYEVDNFMQSFLQYTTDCADGYEPNYLDVQDIIFKCAESSDNLCLDSREMCSVADSTIQELLEQSWNVGDDFFYKAYSLNITLNGQELLSFSEGNATNSFKGSSQTFSQNAGNIDLFLRVYS